MCASPSASPVDFSSPRAGRPMGPSSPRGLPARHRSEVQSRFNRSKLCTTKSWKTQTDKTNRRIKTRTKTKQDWPKDQFTLNLEMESRSLHLNANCSWQDKIEFFKYITLYQQWSGQAHLFICVLIHILSLFDTAPIISTFRRSLWPINWQRSRPQSSGRRSRSSIRMAMVGILKPKTITLERNWFTSVQRYNRSQS